MECSTVSSGREKRSWKGWGKAGVQYANIRQGKYEWTAMGKDEIECTNIIHGIKEWERLEYRRSISDKEEVEWNTLGKDGQKYANVTRRDGVKNIGRTWSRVH